MSSHCPTTEGIPVIEGEVACCSWCKIPLFRDGLPPFTMHGRRFHTVCARAYARDFLARVDPQPVLHG